jgi:tetratricopeptide (TPR) repeat protein
MIFDILLGILSLIIFFAFLHLLFRLLSPFTRLLSISFVVRWIALRFSRIVGLIRYRLMSGWIPPVFWLVATAIIVWLIGTLSTFDKSVFNPGFRAWLRTLDITSLLNVLTGIGSKWSTILLVYTILLLFWWVWQAGRRVVVEEFVDYTNSSDNQTKSVARGLATLLVVRLGQLRDLYQTVDEQRAILTSVWVHQSIDATINVEDVSQFLQNAVSAQSEFSLGVLKIPVGTLMSLIGRLVQGPRIIGSLHRDNGKLILTAQHYDGKSSRRWRVDYSVPADQSTQQGNDYLTGMVEELACRMFTDLALSGSVRWRATTSFCEGLHAYRDCLRTPKARRLNLEQAEKNFIETLSEDQKFNLAYYNLGVVYTELGQMDTAENAFKNAIEQNPASWNAFYALALHRYQMAKQAYKDARTKARHKVKHEAARNESIRRDGNGRTAIQGSETGTDVQSATQTSRENELARAAILAIEIDQDILTKAETTIAMCQRVIDLQPGSATLAKANQLRGSANELLCELQYLDLCQHLHKILKQNLEKEKDDATVKALDLVNEEVDKIAHYRLDELRYKQLRKLVLGLKPEVDGLIELESVAKARKEASKSHRRAIGQSWNALCLAELRGEGRAGIENSEIPHLETLASVCLCNKAAEYRRRKEFQKAKTLLKQALKLNHADADYLAFYSFELGNTFYEWGISPGKDEKKLDEAKSAYRHAIRIRQEKIVYWACLALTYAQLNQFDKASTAIERVLDYVADASDEDFEEAFERITDKDKIFKVSGDKSYLARLIEVVRIFLEEEREVCEAEDRMNKGELTSDEYEKEILENLAEHDTTGQAWGYAHNALALGRLPSYTGNQEKREILKKYYEAAKNWLDQILKEPGALSPWEDGQISWALGTLYLELEKIQEVDSGFISAEYYGEQEHKYAKDAEMHFRHALVCLEKQHDDEIRLRRIRALLAQSLLKQGSYEKYLQALIEVKRAVTIDSMGYFDREVLGEVYFSLKEFDEAIATWKDALLWRNASLSEPDAPDIYYKLGNAHMELGEHSLEPARRRILCQEAIDYLKKALALYKSDQQRQKGQAYYWLGNLHRKLGRYGEAITYFSISQTLGFANLTSTFYLACAYLKNNEYGESLKQFRNLFDEADKRQSGDDRYKRIVEPETKEPITLVEFKALACYGQALAYTESDMDLEEAENHIRKALGYAEELIKGLTKPHFQAEYKHWQGWIHFKRNGDIQNAIVCLQQALALSAHAEIYLHLALVHEASLEQIKEMVHVQSIVSKVRMYCQHVQALDFNSEYVQLVADLLQRLEKRSKSVNKLGTQAHKPPMQSNHVNSGARKQTTT